MNAKKFIAAAVAAQLSIMCAAVAQEPSGAPPNETVFFVSNGAAPIMPLGGNIDVLSALGSVMGGVVKGKPYSAESVTESTQMLADGNRITTTNRSRVYRDSEGRTRREQQLDSVGVWKSTEPVSMITIDDPVAQLSYFVDPKTETVRKLMNTRVQVTARTVNVEGQTLTLHDTVVEAGDALHGQLELHADRLEADLHSGELTGAGELRGAPPVHIGMAPTGVAFGVRALGGPMGVPVEEDLGEQVIEGVLAHGNRVTTTIEAGAIGNERPIEIVHEQWYSPDIEAVVLRRDFDPRFGETTYRLVNVDRSEPPSELFAIPQDYEVLRDAAPPRTVMRALPADPAGAPARPGRRVVVVQPEPAGND